MTEINDIYNRAFKTLRVSLLSRCNLSCVYCTMGEDEVKDNNAHQHPAPADQLLRQIEQLHRVLQLETVRLTGGEPLLYHEIAPLLQGIRNLGIPNIRLTTNGFLLERSAATLYESGLQTVNVSLDAVNEDRFFLMTKRTQADKVLKGIDAALAAGLKVKINSVIMKGINEDQVLPLLRFAFERGITLRFLEVMAMGHLHSHAAQYLFTQEALLEVISKAYSIERLPRKEGSTANYWQTKDGSRFGIIANESEPFCRDCNRLRLDSTGHIYGCLSSNQPIALRETDDTATLITKLQEAMDQKQKVKFTGSELSMLRIGG